MNDYKIINEKGILHLLEMPIESSGFNFKIEELIYFYRSNNLLKNDINFKKAYDWLLINHPELLI